MKSPREILLQRHRNAEPDLDAIRRSVVRDLSAKPRTPAAPYPFLLRDLFRLGRWQVGSLAGAWLLILLLNVDLPSGRSDTTVITEPQPAEVMLAIRENRQRVAQEFTETTTAIPQSQPTRNRWLNFNRLQVPAPPEAGLLRRGQGHLPC